MSSLRGRYDMKTKPPSSMRHAEIRDGLRAAGSSLSALARELGVAGPTVTIVSQGHRRSRRIERAIAERLGRDVRDVFPDRYREDSMTPP